MMKRHINNMHIYLLAAILQLMVIPLAHAQIFVEQGKVSLNVAPGDNMSGTLLVHNTSNETMRVRIYWEDFVYQPPFTGDKKFLPAGTTPYSLAQWVSFTPKEYIFPPFGKKEISYVVNVPADAQGGYYGVLFIEKDAQELKAAKGVSIVTRVGSLFFIETENKGKHFNVADWTAGPNMIKGGFVNEGNVILIPEGTFYLLDEDGIVADRGRIEARYVPPQEKAEVSFNLNPNLKDGVYHAVVTFDLKEGDVLVKEFDIRKTNGSQLDLMNIKD